MAISPELNLDDVVNTRGDFKQIIEEIKDFVNNYENNTQREPGATYSLKRVIDLAMLPKEVRPDVLDMVVQALYRLRMPIELLMYSGIEDLPEHMIQVNNLRWTDDQIEHASIEVYQIEPNTTLH